MKKKIGIITLQSYTPNYGNRLQNYAVQEVYTKLGYIPETLFYNKNYNTFKQYIKSAIKVLSFGKIKRSADSIYTLKKRQAFGKFNDKYINYAIVSKISDVEKNYDFFSVGSDQVWNPKWLSERLKERFFLDFKAENKKLAFSASFGVDAISYDQKIVDCLKDFKAISVREEAGAKIINDLTGEKATVLVDPTMLLSQEEWRKIAKKPKNAKEDEFILTYFLSPKCNEACEKLEEIRKDKEVYELLDPKDKIAGMADPSEFLWLFDHADIILTDSFHACIFSFLFDKPFIVFDRNWNGGNMNSRLETLLSKLGVERKYIHSGLENDIWEHDYREGNRQLKLEREYAVKFLKEALEE